MSFSKLLWTKRLISSNLNNLQSTFLNILKTLFSHSINKTTLRSFLLKEVIRRVVLPWNKKKRNSVKEIRKCSISTISDIDIIIKYNSSRVWTKTYQWWEWIHKRKAIKVISRKVMKLMSISMRIKSILIDPSPNKTFIAIWSLIHKLIKRLKLLQ